MPDNRSSQRGMKISGVPLCKKAPPKKEGANLQRSPLATGQMRKRPSYSLPGRQKERLNGRRESKKGTMGTQQLCGMGEGAKHITRGNEKRNLDPSKAELPEGTAGGEGSPAS